MTTPKQNSSRETQFEAQRSLADALPAIVLEADPDGTVVFVNRRFREYTGLSPEDVAAGRWRTAIHAEDAEGLRTSIAAAMRSRGQWEHELRMRSAGGEWRWFLMQIAPIFDNGEQLAGWVATGIDVHARRCAEEQLAESRHRYRSLMDAIPASVFTTALDGQVTYTNERWLEYSGRPLVHSGEGHLLDFIHPADRPATEAAAIAGREAGVPFENEFRARRADGEYRWQLARTVPLKDEDGNVVEWVGASVDIEDRHRAEEAERFLSLVSSVLSSSLDLATTLERAAHVAVPYLGDACIIDLVQPDGTIAVAAVAHIDPAGEALELDMRTRFPVRPNTPHPVAEAISTGKTVRRVMTDEVLGQITYSPEHLRMKRSLGPREWLTVPLIARGRVLGAMTCFRTDPDEHYSALQVELAEDLARREAFALDNARLYTELEQSQEVRRVSEEKYRSLTESIPVLVGTAKPSGSATFMSERWVEFTGVPQDDLLGAGWQSLVHPEDLGPLLEAFRAAMDGDFSVDAEFRLRRADGAYRWHLNRVRPVRDAQGDALFGVFTSVDIDHRKRGEQAQHFLAEASNVLGSSLDPAGALAHVAELAVPAIADWCRIDIRDEATGEPRLLTLYHRDPAKREAAMEIEANFRAPAEGAFSYQEAFRTGETNQVTFTSELLEKTFRRRKNLALMRSIGLRSTLSAPVKLGGEVVAVITLATAESGRPLDKSDREMAEELARRTAMAFEYSRLYMQIAQLNRDLQRRLQDFETLLEVLPIGIGIATTPDGSEIRANPAFAQMLHIQPGVNASLNGEDGRQLPFRVMDGDRVMQPHELPLQLAASHGESVRDVELKVTFEDGSSRQLLEFAAPLFDEHGEPRGSVGAFIDVTERRQAEERERFLAQISEALATSLDYRTMLPLLAELTVEALGDTCLLDVFNGHAWAHRVAAARDERNAELMERLVGYELRLSEPNARSHVLATGRAVLSPITDEILESYASDAEQLATMRALEPRESIFVPLQAHGENLGVVTITRNQGSARFTKEDVAFAEEIGRRAALSLANARLLEQATEAAMELRRANAAKDEFLGLVSHELRTPLTTILGNSQVLNRHGQKLPTAAREMALQDIASDAERLQRIVENMLILARVEVTEGLEPEPVLVQRLAPRIIAQHQTRFPDRQFEVDLPEDLPTVSAQPTYLEQIMQNLISNAEKYSPAEVPIIVRARAGGDEVVVSVLDNGAGITDDDAKHLFTPFFRASRTSGKVPGAGLGLAVCRRLTEALGGRIWARPRPEGGTEMSFTLPVMNAEEM